MRAVTFLLKLSSETPAKQREKKKRGGTGIKKKKKGVGRRAPALKKTGIIGHIEKARSQRKNRGRRDQTRSTDSAVRQKKMPQ